MVLLLGLAAGNIGRDNLARPHGSPGGFTRGPVAMSTAYLNKTESSRKRLRVSRPGNAWRARECLPATVSHLVSAVSLTLRLWFASPTFEPAAVDRMRKHLSVYRSAGEETLSPSVEGRREQVWCQVDSIHVYEHLFSPIDRTTSTKTGAVPLPNNFYVTTIL